MIVCVNIYYVIGALYFLIGLVFAVVVFRQQRGSMGAISALVFAVIMGIFWIVMAILVPFTRRGKQGEETAETNGVE